MAFIELILNPKLSIPVGMCCLILGLCDDWFWALVGLILILIGIVNILVRVFIAKTRETHWQKKQESKIQELESDPHTRPVLINATEQEIPVLNNMEQATSDKNDFVIAHGTLIHYTGAGGSVVIPEGVTKIGKNAFSWCSRLKTIVIPNGVTEIGKMAFYECRNLESIVIPEGVTKIGAEAFGWCTSLIRVSLPASVTEIAVSAFNGHSSLTIHASEGSYAWKYAIVNLIPLAVAQKRKSV